VRRKTQMSSGLSLVLLAIVGLFVVLAVISVIVGW
jgi:hypothetical protein